MWYPYITKKNNYKKKKKKKLVTTIFEGLSVVSPFQH
jgi:hypothetical protein